MTRSRAASLLCAALGSSAALNGAQQPSGGTPPQFPAQVELITVDAVVVDAKGNPVTGLTRDDFILKEDGQVRELLAFEAVAVPPRPSTPTPASVASSPPRPHVVTSAPAAPRNGSTFLIVFDDLHLTGTTAASARTTLGRFLRESVSDGDQVVIVSTATGAAWSGALPADGDDLLAFLARLQGRLAGNELMTEHEAQRIAENGDKDVLQRVVGRYLGQAACVPPLVPSRPTDEACDAHVRGDGSPCCCSPKGSSTTAARTPTAASWPPRSAPTPPSTSSTRAASRRFPTRHPPPRHPKSD